MWRITDICGTGPQLHQLNIHGFDELWPHWILLVKVSHIQKQNHPQVKVDHSIEPRPNFERYCRLHLRCQQPLNSKIVGEIPIFAGWIHIFVGSLMWVVEPPILALVVLLMFAWTPRVFLVFWLNSPHLPRSKRSAFFVVSFFSFHHCPLC